MIFMSDNPIKKGFLICGFRSCGRPSPDLFMTHCHSRIHIIGSLMRHSTITAYMYRLMPKRIETPWPPC